MSLSEDFQIVPAQAKDCAEILKFIKGLAHYEKLSHEVTATEEKLKETLFGPHPAAEVVFAVSGGKKVGFALYFQTYSTFLAQPGIYLEDLYVLPEHRGYGFGKKLLVFLAQQALARGCGRLEWSVLDWNKPAIDFYLNLGAQPMMEWTVYRLAGDALKKFGHSSS
jgi:GNAT superfamily N-acetyltransferase